MGNQNIKNLIYHIQIFIKKHESHLSSGALFLGFIVDNLTLKRIDLLFENIVLSSYLLLALLSILFFNLYEGGRAQLPIFSKFRPWTPFVMQYAFGALLSGFVIFYTKSASIFTSWPFLLLLISLFIGNEFLKVRYARFIFHMSVFFFLLFSFMIFYVPILIRSMGTWVFLLSGAISLLAISVCVLLFGKMIPARVMPHRRKLMASIGSIFFLMNLLYFTNILPPIPLALKNAGIYYFIERTEKGDYRARFQAEQWYEKFKLHKTVHITHNAPLYAFSSVFAPTDLNTEIVHEWRYYDPVKKSWTTLLKTPFPIVGGRDGGYRGYSIKTSVFPGKWRVEVKTKNGLLIGRKSFMVEVVGDPPVLEEAIL